MTDAEAGPTGRLFIAAPLPPAVRATLAAARAAFDRAGAPRLRWVRPEGIHLTLRFLGQTPLSQRAPIAAAMAEAVAAAPTPRLRLDGWGVFGDGRPRVLWAGLAGDLDALAACAERLNRALEAGGFPAERRALRPHLTLARVPPRASAEDRDALLRALGRVAPPPPLPLPVAELHLILSRLGRGGATYDTLTISGREVDPAEA